MNESKTNVITDIYREKKTLKIEPAREKVRGGSGSDTGDSLVSTSYNPGTGALCEGGGGDVYG